MASRRRRERDRKKESSSRRHVRWRAIEYVVEVASAHLPLHPDQPDGPLVAVPVVPEAREMPLLQVTDEEC